MASTPPPLDPDQTRALEHGNGPLLVLGGPGSGKSLLVGRRLEALATRGVARDRILCLTPFEGLGERSFAGFATQLLRESAQDMGLDPFFEPVGPHDRLAMLLAELDELSLREHQIRGEPARLLAGFVERIDRHKAEMRTASELQARAAELERRASDEAQATAARMEREFAEVYARHDLILRRNGALDLGEVVLEAVELLRRRADLRQRTAGRFEHLLVDDMQATTPAQRALMGELRHSDSPNVWATSAADVPDFNERFPAAELVRLERSYRCGPDMLDAARAVMAGTGAGIEAVAGGEGRVRFWRCASDRAQAQAVAREIERLLAGGDSQKPSGISVLVDSPRKQGPAIAAALEERGIPHRLRGAGELLRRPEVRDLLAWLRMLADPSDSGAAVRALTRAPVELRSIDLARVMSIARRRKLDMISALRASLESPQLPPEARDRIRSFLDLYGAATSAFEEMRPDVFVHRLTQRIGLRRQQLFAAQPRTVERLVNVSRLAELASRWSGRHPRGSVREFVHYVTAVADSGLGPDASEGGRGEAVTVMPIGRSAGSEFDHVYVVGLHSEARLTPDLMSTAITRARREVVLSWVEQAEGRPARPSPLYDKAKAVLAAEEEPVEEELFGPSEGLQSTFRMMRDELLETVSSVGSQLGELRLDTSVDVNRAVARYLELLKLSALVQRSPDQPLEDSLKALNELLAKVASPEQMEALEGSAVDAYVLDSDADERRRRAATRARYEPSLEAFIPRRGQGLALSATDIETYRACPLRYKFARVFTIPKEPTIHQRFGIVIHQVLERFHGSAADRPAGDDGLDRILSLFDSSWRRSGFGTADDELQLRDKAIAALTRFWERQREETAEPVWFERGFAFQIGPHHLRGRVDRVDRLPSGGYELIDYKTGRPRSREQLRDDVQLSLYGIGARRAWQVEPEAQSYYYVLDDVKVAVSSGEEETARVEQVVMEIGGGIMDQDFEPTPSPDVCGMCDYRLVCPAAEV